MKTPIGIGIAGSGWAGQNAAAKIEGIPRARVSGIYDVNADAAAALAGKHNAPVFARYEDLLDAADCSAVVIASPQFAHKEQVLLAAARRKHIFCEKPMALNVADCDEMLRAARRARVKFCVGQVLRLLAPYALARPLIESERLGAPLGLSIARCGGSIGDFKNPDHWRARQALCGGRLLEFSVHELDFMRHVCGEPVEVFAQARKIAADATDYPDLWFVQVRFDGGAIGLLRSSQSDYVGAGYFTVQCPGGTISTNNAQRRIQLRRADGTERPIADEELARLENGYLWEIRSWVESILDGTPMIVDAWDGRMAVAMACAAMKSAETGRPVRLRARRKRTSK